MSNDTSRIEQVELQLQSFQEFINIIQDQTLKDALKLSETKSIKLDGKTYTKKPLTAKQFAEITKLNNRLGSNQKQDEQVDNLVTLRTQAALYYFGIPEDVFDKHFEKLNPIMEGCILRSTTGLSPDTDLNKLLLEYQEKQK